MIHAIFFKTVYGIQSTVYQTVSLCRYPMYSIWRTVYANRQYTFMQYMLYKVFSIRSVGFPGDAVFKNPPANARYRRDVGLIPGSGRSSGGGNGNPRSRILI